jgi:hypothetical protein
MNTEKFSTEDKKMLEQRLSSYGAKAECVRQTGVRYATIQKVLETGEATTAVLLKLRLYMHNIPSRVFVEEAA